ncbi:hypothetical protein V6N13_028074 [Hibiscus sabdariffa]|uniref:RNase H type-1 domain-containing protein n=1 Tax=Hibiscus sabdariffa TaxID=183260 RepID=A0ABR2B0Y2_9ROSI
MSSWIKAKFGECSISLDCIVNDPFVATNLCLEPGSRVVALCQTPPPVGFAKLNVDGPLSSSLKMGGLGGCEIRGGGFSGFRLVLECDCRLVINWLSCVSIPPFCFLNLVLELARIISSRGFLLHWVPRSCNFVADSLAKASIG